MSLTETTKPVVRSATDPANASATQPVLMVSVTSNYQFVYWDKGSGATLDVSIFRPQPQQGYFITGDYAQGNYNPAIGSSQVLSVVNDDPANPMLVPPTGYQLVWNDVKSGGDMDGSIWYPIPPPGYVSLGFVGQAGYDIPNIPSYRCVRQDLVKQGIAGPLIWSDQKSGATMDVSLYSEQNASGCFVAQGNYNPFTGTVYTLSAS